MRQPALVKKALLCSSVLTFLLSSNWMVKGKTTMGVRFRYRQYQPDILAKGIKKDVIGQAYQQQNNITEI
jgi:hypothetical protein